MDLELTRGDTKILKFRLTYMNGEKLELADTDKIYFTVKKKPESKVVLIQKTLNNGITLKEDGYYYIIINSDDTAELSYSTYYYDLEIKTITGIVKTLLVSTITLTVECTHKQDEIVSVDNDTNVEMELDNAIDITADLEMDFLRGEPGPSNTLTIGTVEKGEEARASIEGKSPNQTLNLVLPKGDKPVAGIDYFTVAEKEEFKQTVVEDSKTEINNHTNEKKTELNTHTEGNKDKLNAYTKEKETELNTHKNTLEQELNNIADGVKDMATAIQFATFEVNDNMHLSIKTADKLANTNFIYDEKSGRLGVEIA